MEQGQIGEDALNDYIRLGSEVIRLV